MKRSLLILCVTVFSFASLLLTVGYAAISGSLNISGDADYKYDPPLIQITEVIAQRGTLDQNVGVSGNVLSSKITLSDNSAVLAITVRNNSDKKQDVVTETYGYNSVTRYEVDGITYNNNIVYTIYSDAECTTPIEKGGVLIDKGTNEETKFGFIIEPGSGNEKTFYVKFIFAEGADTSQNVLESVLSFNFMPLEEIYQDSTEEAIVTAMHQFDAILNNKIETKTGENSFDYLINQMEKDSENDRVLTDYIGNVQGASADDKEIIDELFQGRLNVNIDGVDTPVTFLIKYEDVYAGASGNEMTIYMTTEDLTQKKSTHSLFGGHKPAYAQVFACTFIKHTDTSGNTKWIQLTDMIEGTAVVCDYDGGMAWGRYPTGSGSFRTDDWRTTDNKTITQALKG